MRWIAIVATLGVLGGCAQIEAQKRAAKAEALSAQETAKCEAEWQPNGWTRVQEADCLTNAESLLVGLYDVYKYPDLNQYRISYRRYVAQQIDSKAVTPDAGILAVSNMLVQVEQQVRERENEEAAQSLAAQQVNNQLTDSLLKAGAQMMAPPVTYAPPPPPQPFFQNGLPPGGVRCTSYGSTMTCY